MKLAIFTNTLSIHQIPIGKVLATKLPGQFSLVCWEPTSKERIELGWENDVDLEWVVKAWVSVSEYQKAVELLKSADVVIWGYAPLSLINQRIIEDKLTFRYTERLFKGGRRILFSPNFLVSLIKTYRWSHRENYHLLAVGPYCAEDFKLLGLFKDRMWRWGYFPEVFRLAKTKKPNNAPVILWAGRMISWKRVRLLLEAVAWVRRHSEKEILLRIIGYGPEEEFLSKLAKNLKLSDICSFEGPKNPKEIAVAMQKADIYVLPSDRNEGWGAVVNEAMSQGCCVIGCNLAGSVPWLIENGLNGFVFEGYSASELGKILIDCLEHPNRICEMGKAAQQTIMNLWCPDVAAERLLKLIDALIIKRKPSFQDEGPCSPA